MDDINTYRKSFPAFLNFLEKRKFQKLEVAIAEFSATSGIPILILYQFLGEKDGFSENIVENIKRIKKFYNLGE